MAIDLSQIDKDIQLLLDIKKLLSDPDSAALVERYTKKNSSNGNSGHKAEAESPTATKLGREPIQMTMPPPPAFSLSTEVRKAVALMPDGFEVGELGDAMRSRGLAVDNRPIGKVLQYLVKVGEVRIVQRGAGSVPNKYAKTDRLRVE